MNRRTALLGLLSGAAVFAPRPILAQSCGCPSTVPMMDVRDFGGDLQAAIDASRSAGPAFGTLQLAGRVFLPDASYQIGSLNLTGLIGLHLIGKGPWGVTLYADQQTTPSPVLDLTGSVACRVEGIHVACTTPGGTPPTVWPSVGFLIAGSTGGDSTRHEIVSSGVSGWTQHGGLFAFGTTNHLFQGANFEQSNPDAPAAYIGAHNPWGVTSPSRPIAGGVQTTGEMTFLQCGMGNQLASARWGGLLIYNAFVLRWIGGVMGGGGPEHLRFWGAFNRTFLLEGVQFESEAAAPARYVCFAEHAIVNGLTLIAPDVGANGASEAYLGHVGNGQFPDAVIVGGGQFPRGL